MDVRLINIGFAYDKQTGHYLHYDTGITVETISTAQGVYNIRLQDGTLVHSVSIKYVEEVLMNECDI